MCHDEIALNGWTSTPANPALIFGNKPYINAPTPIPLSKIDFPSTDPIVSQTLDYVTSILPRETLNHSMRVYHYGKIIQTQQFPTSPLQSTTWALACLLHDIGTAPSLLTSTHMSFDLFGGIKALSVLTSFGCPTDVAEAVAEAIIRHQDLGVDGNITFLGQLIQLATIYDNVGEHPQMKDLGGWEINTRWKREGWSGVFAGVIREEVGVKPWCHSTHVVGFEGLVRGNMLLREWE
ncbi:cyanamide hydratase [Aspergillus sclerotioniger CBS 115572]|uniref:Cyanamide hydratase n=1 Tax=Aspergillus sclerotioniger CBS 115572 TaxID=1450535 RepID=A0A317VYS3_9EURO|nr:cyanamide hydratase [Aspergillus sclerotioniger CBS 115572]PWY79516.1 cyanamide hydratase [Aspergillus sclerotioniger CBS 115572]